MPHELRYCSVLGMLTAIVACSTPAPTAPAPPAYVGTYQLTAIDGHAVPAPLTRPSESQFCTLTSAGGCLDMDVRENAGTTYAARGTLVLRADSTFGVQVVDSTPAHVDTIYHHALTPSQTVELVPVPMAVETQTDVSISGTYLVSGTSLMLKETWPLNATYTSTLSGKQIGYDPYIPQPGRNFTFTKP